MNFFISVLSTLLLGLVVGFALSLQSAEPPTEFEKYSSVDMDYATMSEVGYAMAAYGRQSTAEYFELKNYQAYGNQAQGRNPVSGVELEAQTQAQSQPHTSNQNMPKNNAPQPASTLQKSRPMQIAQAEPPNLNARQKHTSGWPKKVIGIQQETDLMRAGEVWQAFSEQSSLSNQLDSYTVSVFAIYSNFSSDYSRATISIGYDKPGMKGDSFTMPIGETQSLLKPSNYGNNELVNAWQDIDYSRTVIAVIERRDYTQNSELTSLFVIYK